MKLTKNNVTGEAFSVLDTVDYKHFLESLNKDMSKQVEFLQAVSHILDNNQMQALYDGVIELYKGIYDNLSINPDLLSLVQEKNNILQTLIDNQEKLNSLITIKPKYPKEYTTSNNRAEFILFFNNEKDKRINLFITNTKEDDLLGISKSDNSKDDLCSLAIICNSKEDEKILIDNTPLVGALLSAINGVVYEPCYNLYQNSKGTNRNFETQNRPSLTYDMIYKYFTTNTDSRFDMISKQEQDFLKKVINIFTTTKIQISIKDNNNPLDYKATIFPSDEGPYRNAKGLFADENAFYLNSIPPLLWVSLYYNHVQKVSFHNSKTINFKSNTNYVLRSYLNRYIYVYKMPIPEGKKVADNQIITHVSISFDRLREQFCPDIKDRPYEFKQRVLNILHTLKEDGVFYESLPEYYKGATNEKELASKLKTYDSVEIQLFDDDTTALINKRNADNKKLRNKSYQTQKGKIKANIEARK